MTGMSSSDYQKVYDKARIELAELLTQQEQLEKRIVIVRQLIQSLATLCESEGIEVQASAEATDLLRNSAFADEIRVLLKSQYPGWMRPAQVRDHLVRLGHDLSKYQNAQSTVHMVLRRMADSGDVQETTLPTDGKKVYRCVPQVPSLNDPENPLYKSGMRPSPDPVQAAITALGFGQPDELPPQARGKETWVSRATRKGEKKNKL